MCYTTIVVVENKLYSYYNYKINLLGGTTMISKFFKENKVVAVFATIVRIYLGYTWLEAGLHKITGGFNAAGFLHGAIAKPVVGPEGNVLYGWFVSFLQHFAIPNAHLFNVLIPYGEFLVGLGLILGCLTGPALFFALVMNFSYIFAGTISSNPLDILMAVALLYTGANARRFGLDRWVIPAIKRISKKKERA